MKTAATLFRFLEELLKVMLFKWILILVKIIKAIFKKIVEFCKRRKLPRAERKEINQRCVPLKSRIYYKPDPLLYSQYFLMEKGLSVTWDNPDIRLKKGGVYVDSSLLEIDTEYEIEAQIWNNSIQAPAPDLPVRFSYLDFGIGTTPIFIGQTTTDLGIKGSPACPAYATVKWRTPATAGHYCLQVLLIWSDDAEPNNNLGQENTNVGVFQSPAQFTFKVENRKKRKERIRFEIDTYTLPKLPDCGQRKKREDRIAIHKKGNYPVPEGWKVELVPEVVFLQSGESREIKAVITPPDSFKGEKTFNINGFDSKNVLTGGITLFTKTKP